MQPVIECEGRGEAVQRQSPTEAPDKINRFIQQASAFHGRACAYRLHMIFTARCLSDCAIFGAITKMGPTLFSTLCFSLLRPVSSSTRETPKILTKILGGKSQTIITTVDTTMAFSEDYPLMYATVYKSTMLTCTCVAGHVIHGKNKTAGEVPARGHLPLCRTGMGVAGADLLLYCDDRPHCWAELRIPVDELAAHGFQPPDARCVIGRTTTGRLRWPARRSASSRTAYCVATKRA